VLGLLFMGLSLRLNSSLVSQVATVAL
jgi:hypothetical protein